MCFLYSLRHSANSWLVSAAPTGLLLLFSSYLTLALSLPPCLLIRSSFYLNLSGRFDRSCFLSPFLSGYIGSPVTRFSRVATWLMSWPDRERYLCCLQSLVVSLLFSRTGGVLSHPKSSAYKFSRFPPRNLCSLVTLAVFSLVYAATDTAYC